MRARNEAESRVTGLNTRCSAQGMRTEARRPYGTQRLHCTRGSPASGRCGAVRRSRVALRREAPAAAPPAGPLAEKARSFRRRKKA
ncbi:hypothetical protein KV564_00685 [Paenibacillus chitinolyticus]|nr:hypothetical protein [Paenibacillus chitinolyticus]